MREPSRQIWLDATPGLYALPKHPAAADHVCPEGSSREGISLPLRGNGQDLVRHCAKGASMIWGCQGQVYEIKEGTFAR